MQFILALLSSIFCAKLLCKPVLSLWLSLLMQCVYRTKHFEENSASAQKQVTIIEPRSFAYSISGWCKLHQNEVLIANENADGEMHHGQSSFPFLISLQKRKCLTPCLELALSLCSSGLKLIHRPSKK